MAIGTVNLGKRAASVDVSPQLDGYTQVIINVTDELCYTAGNTTGRTLEMTCPWGSQSMADNILDQIRGYQYQPYVASGALLDPAAELGDGLTINGVYGGLYKQGMQFDALCASDAEAPHDEEIDHEYPYQSPEKREIIRQNAYVNSQLAIQADKITAEVNARTLADSQLQSTLNVQADEISAKVSKSGGSSSSFGWTLNDSSWTLSSNGSTVLQASKDGLEVKGKIAATSGTIGGFTINSNSISYNNQTWGGTNTQGIYIGPNGLQLGKNFQVDNAGNLTANNGTFGGTVRASQILYGGDYNGTFDGAGLTAGSVSGGYGGAIGSGAVTTMNTSGGINTSLGYADYANTVFQGLRQTPYIKAQRGIFDSISMGTSALQFTRQSLVVSTPTGNKQIQFIGLI